jgi:hypothetical protein
MSVAASIAFALALVATGVAAGHVASALMTRAIRRGAPLEVAVALPILTIVLSAAAMYALLRLIA